MLTVYTDTLKKHHLKRTPKRIAIVEIFLKKRRCLTPEDVWKDLQKKFKQCGLPGVYRNLESLSECGILCRLQKFDEKRSYALCTTQLAPHHHHIVCVTCGRVEEVFGCDLLKKKTVNGFKVIGHFLQLDGICTDCRQQEKQ